MGEHAELPIDRTAILALTEGLSTLPQHLQVSCKQCYSKPIIPEFAEYTAKLKDFCRG
jgi:hypothetical protein